MGSRVVVVVVGGSERRVGINFEVVALLTTDAAFVSWLFCALCVVVA